MTTKLCEWIQAQKKTAKTTGFTVQGFADSVGIHRIALWAIAKGKGTSLATALLIEKKTGGAVRCRDLINMPKKPQSAAAAD